MNRILSLLEKDANLTAAQIAAMLGMKEADVAAQIKKFESEGVILGYRATVNWEKTDRELVSAIIELKVTPQLNEGFDKVAEQIEQFPEVASVYLMSGGFDIAVMVEGKTMKEVALFVAEKLAPMQQVLSTATHFVLRKYKVDGILLNDKSEDSREVITL